MLIDKGRRENMEQGRVVIIREERELNFHQEKEEMRLEKEKMRKEEYQ